MRPGRGPDRADDGSLAWVAAPGSSDSAPAPLLATALTPALAALADGRLGAVRVITAGFEFRFSRWTRWRAWRRTARFVADLRACVEAAPA